jgi:hypothetical protein
MNKQETIKGIRDQLKAIKNAIRDQLKAINNAAMYRVSVLIWLLVALASSLVVVFIARPNATKQFLGHDADLFRLTYQFLLITVIGGGVVHVFNQLDRLRAMRQSLREMHTDLLKAYNQAKTVRRKLRAQLGPIDRNPRIWAKLYEDQMDSLSDAQLTFEIHAKRAKEQLWYRRNSGLAGPLGKIEKYLNDIVKEYEGKHADFSGEPPQCPIGDLLKLKGFIGPYSEAKEFKEEFKCAMKDALAALDKAILR